MSNPSKNIKDSQADRRKRLIQRIQEEGKNPLTASEIRQQVASYIASHMDNYPREKIDEYLDKNYGEINS